MAENNQTPKPTPNLKPKAPKAKAAPETDIKKPSPSRRPKPAAAESQLSGAPKPAPAPAPDLSGKISASVPFLSEMSKGVKIIPAVPEDPTPPPAPAVELKQRPAKPQVEGINAPYAAPPLAQVPKLTQAEVKIIKEVETPGKIFSPQLTKSGSVQNLKLQGPKKTLWPYIILALILGGFLLWQYTGLGESLKNYISPKKTVSVSPAKTINTIPASPTANPAPAAVSIATTTPVQPVAPSVPAKPATKLQITATPTGWLNVRTQPSLNGTIITKVHPGETYTYSQTQNGWYRITLPDGSLGWISGRYITKVK